MPSVDIYKIYQIARCRHSQIYLNLQLENQIGIYPLRNAPINARKLVETLALLLLFKQHFSFSQLNTCRECIAENSFK